MPLEPNYYNLISRALEEGITAGYRKAYKYQDQPEEDVIKDEIHSAIMSELTNIFNFSIRE